MLRTADKEFLGCLFGTYSYEDSLAYSILENFKDYIGVTDSFTILLRSLLCFFMLFYVDYALGSKFNSSEFLADEDMIVFLCKELDLRTLDLSRVEYLRSLILLLLSVSMVRFLFEIWGRSSEVLETYLSYLREFWKKFLFSLVLVGYGLEFPGRPWRMSKMWFILRSLRLRVYRMRGSIVW